MADAIHEIASDGAGTRVAVGANGVILKSINDGPWDEMVSGTTNGLYGVIYGGPAGGNQGWIVVGQGGIILISNDGVLWTTETPFTGSNLYGVASSGDMIMAIGGSGVLGLSVTLGEVWDEKSSGVSVDLYDISANESNYIIVGDEDTVIVGSLTSLSMESYIREDMSINPEMEDTGSFQHVMADNMEVVSGYNWESAGVVGGELQHIFTADGIGVFDYSPDPNGAFIHSLTESIDFLTMFVGLVGFRDNISEGFSSDDSTSNLRAILLSVSESLQSETDISVIQAIIVKEAVDAIGSALINGNYFGDIGEGLSVKALYVVSFLLLLSEDIDISDSSAGTVDKLVTVVEKLTALGLAPSTLSASIAVSTGFILSEGLLSGKGADVFDGIDLSEEVVQKIIGLAVQIETVKIESAVLTGMVLSLPVSESLDVFHDLSLNSILLQAINDGLAFSISFGSGGETYSGLVMNTESFGVAAYSNYPFNSFAKIGDSYYGANGNGLYLLEGESDDGENISASCMLGKSDFGTPLKTGMVEAYLGIVTDGEIILKVVTDDNIERWYRSNAGKTSLDNARFKMARGVKSNYWQVGLENVDGSDFELSEIEMIRIVMSRR